MIVGACGFGSTGSSAVSDYLKEYSTFQVLDKIEFNWISAPDGLEDLDYHLNNPNGRTSDSIIAIERYKELCKSKEHSFERIGIPKAVFRKSVNEFIDSITLVSWKWYSPQKQTFIKNFLIRVINRLGIITKWENKYGIQWEGYPYENVLFSVKPKDFDHKAQTHVMELFSAMGADFSKPIVLDQPFPGNNPQACFKYFDDPYAIVVDRDPRDNYVFAKTVLLKKGMSHFMPIKTVEDFVKYYRAIRDNQPYKEKNERILRLNFEDMVYHYDETTKKIRDFLHLSENPNPKSIFDPLISMPNTQVWKRFPEYAKDIEYIERELKEYLFDYTGCPEPDPNGKMFRGKSPKNK